MNAALLVAVESYAGWLVSNVIRNNLSKHSWGSSFDETNEQ